MRAGAGRGRAAHARFATRGSGDGAGGCESEGNGCRLEGIDCSPAPRGRCVDAAVAKAAVVAHAPGHGGRCGGRAEPAAQRGD